jgi:RNA polymerase sigma factor (sigma-70 family)
MPPQAQHIFEAYRMHANELAEGNIRLIWAAFRISPSLWDLPECDLKDLAGVAQEELLHSAKHYNPWYRSSIGEVPYETRFPGLFSTYAVKNMHFMMLNASKELQDMHIPAWRLSQYKTYWDVRALYSDQQEGVSFGAVVAASEFKRANRRFPKPEELQEYFNHVEHDDEARKKHRKQIQSYAKLLLIMQPVSFDALLNGKKQYRDERSGDVEAISYTMEGILPSVDDVPGAVFVDMRREILGTALQRLSERERKVLELRVGITDQTVHTLDDVAQYFGVTKERIRQIEAQGLKKLRHPSTSRMLRDCLIED